MIESNWITLKDFSGNCVIRKAIQEGFERKYAEGLKHLRSKKYWAAIG